MIIKEKFRARLPVGFAITLLIIVLGMAGAIVSGVAVALLPLQLVVGTAALTVVTILALVWQSMKGILIFVIAFGLLPFIPIDGRIATEGIILWAMALIIFNRLIGHPMDLSVVRPFKWPLVGFFLIWLVALLQGYFISHNQFAIADSRRYLGLLSIFVFVEFQNKYREQKPLNHLILFIGVFSALLLILQLGTGWRVFAGVKGFMEGGIGKEFEDVARGSAEGGNYLIAYILFYSLFLLSKSNNYFSKKNSLLIFLVLFSIGGLVAIFSRGIWAGVALGLCLFPFINSRRFLSSIKSIFIMLIGVALVAAAAYPVFPRQIDAAIARVLSVSEEGSKGTSMGARFDENTQALESIRSRPLLGIGHGGEYKKTSRQVSRGFANEVTFIHNSYLWIWVKFGALGLGVVLLLTYRYAQVALSLRRAQDVTVQAIGVAATCTLLVWLVAGLISPVWAQPSDLVAFSAMLVLLGAAKRAMENEAK